MSVPPAGAPGGTGRPVVPRPPAPKRPDTSNPLVARKRQPARLPARSGKPNMSLVTPNGPASLRSEQKMKELEAIRAKNGGWSTKPPEGVHVTEFPLVTTKRALLAGIRHHIMRLNPTKAGKPVDPTDEEEFARPVSLHRRDPRFQPSSRVIVKETSVPRNTEEEAEAERLRQAKADREAQRALDQAQIAPVMKASEPKPKQPARKEKTTGFFGKQSEAQKKEAGIRYEETLPWFLEDADGKNIWQGSYVAPLSELNCALAIQGQSFRMIPLERWYKFDAKPSFNTMSLEEAERLMKDGDKFNKRWVMAEREKQVAADEMKEYRAFLGGRPRVKTESSTSRAARKSERTDDHELDMSGDEFQDDDDAAGFEADDEDTKEAKDRVRRDHLGANMFGEGKEDEVDKEEEAAREEKVKNKQLGKSITKGLVKLEHSTGYKEDIVSEEEDNNPFKLSSDSESEEDKDKKDETKKEEEAKKADGKDMPASGASTKGTTTPSGGKKASDSLKKSKNLKRPGSPNLSDSSGNESSRKKKVKTAKNSSLVPSRSTTPLPGRLKAGATSDGEVTAGEGSDAGQKKKSIKLKTGQTGTPVGSRAGSPVPSGSKPISPSKGAAGGTATPRAHSPQLVGQANDRIQAAEIVQAINAQNGISLTKLFEMFKHRIDTPGNLSKKEWVALVRQNGVYGPDKLLRPKPKAG
ncbi:Rap30/74 interaction domain-containing protein [Thozetella sp. PMI_491]|nr:Rap30/74 interaction domain-containing protein [Thozetella sp. PMI_491]